MTMARAQSAVRSSPKRILVLSAGVLLMLGLCLGAVIFLDGFYLPGKPCRPVQYPNGQRTTNPFKSIVAAEIEDVLTFYDTALNVQPWPADTGLWTRQELTPGVFRYTCYGTDINRLSTETGCVYVRRQTAGTVGIEGMLLRSEGSNAQCPVE